MNKSLHLFNNKFGTNYPDIVPRENVFTHKLNPWQFGESYMLPNINGIAYKQGGKMDRKLLTQL